MSYWWLNSTNKEHLDNNEARYWELLRHTPVYREAWEAQKQHGLIFVDHNPPKVETLNLTLGGKVKESRKVLNLDARRKQWGADLWGLIGAANSSEDFDPDKSWPELGECQKSRFIGALHRLDPGSRFCNLAKYDCFQGRMDYARLKRDERGLEKVVWCSHVSVEQAKPDAEHFPVIPVGEEEDLLFAVFTFDERVGREKLVEQLKENLLLSDQEDRSSLVKGYLNRVRFSYEATRESVENEYRERSNANKDDPLAKEMQHLLETSLPPWGKFRRQQNRIILKMLEKIDEFTSSQVGEHNKSREYDWGRDPLLRISKLIPSVQSPYCQFWVPVGLTIEQMTNIFQRSLREHYEKRSTMVKTPLRTSLSENELSIIRYVPPERFAKVRRPLSRGGVRIGYLWIGLTGLLIKLVSGSIGQDDPVVKGMIKDKMISDASDIRSAAQYVENLIKGLDTYWRSQLLFQDQPE